MTQISLLADHPAFIDTLAPWLLAHWHNYLPQDTLAMRVAKLQAHLNCDKFPIAWVAHRGGEVLGTVALREHDLPDHLHLAPWLGGLFVTPEARGRGIGAALCAHVVQAAVPFIAESRAIYLFTLDKQAWYRKSGWAICEPCVWEGHTGDIMCKLVN
ncbi:MAG: GNAT family N-acetyltransferase [Gammaproteobacteria bacterium]|nr:GNAT family N-acetyltransferase [Gammaproteobacteria bacterium]